MSQLCESIATARLRISLSLTRVCPISLRTARKTQAEEIRRRSLTIADAHVTTETVRVVQTKEKLKAFVTKPDSPDKTDLYRKLRRVRPCNTEAATHAFWRRKQFEVRDVCHRRAKHGTSQVRISRNALRSSILWQFGSRVFS